MYRLCRLVFVLIRVLRLWFPGRDNACSGPFYRPLKHGFFIEGFSFLDGLLGLLVAVVAVVPGRDPSIVLLLQFVPQCEPPREEIQPSGARQPSVGGQHCPQFLIETADNTRRVLTSERQCLQPWRRQSDRLPRILWPNFAHSAYRRDGEDKPSPCG